MLIISEHYVLGLNYSTHSHITLTEGTLIGGIKTQNSVHNSPRCKETSADCQGQCHWNSPADGPFNVCSWCECLLVPWQTGCRLCSVCLFLSMRWYQIYLQKELWGWRGILQYWDLFIESWMESTVNELMMLAPRGTSGLFRRQSGIQNHRRTISNMCIEDYPLWFFGVSMCAVCGNRSCRPTLGLRYNLLMWQNYRMSHFIIGWFNTDVLPAKKFSTFRVSILLSDVSISIGTVASRVFLSDQRCPVALIFQILKAGNVSYQLYPVLLHFESCIR